MRIFVLWSLLFCSFAGSATQVSNGEDEYVSSPVYLGLLEQKEGEPRESFVHRVAIGLSQYTAQTGYEAGGWFCEHQQSKRQVLMVFTERSQIAVTLPKGCPNEHFNVLEESIHSHPHVRQIRLQGNDIPLYNQGRWWKAREGKVASFSPRKFSSNDKTHEQGYMVYQNELYHQIKGRARFVAHVDLSQSVSWQSRLED